MVNDSYSAPNDNTMRTFEQGAGREAPSTKDQPVPKGALLASFVRTLETRLIEKGLLTAPREEFHPFWFLVETERNVFLWRNGLSLSNADEFEFWVDPAALVEKRLLQLDHGEPGNPFVNSLWGVSSGISHLTANEEREYLQTLLENLAKVAPHANALSHVSSILGKELLQPRLPRIVLPARGRRSKAL